MRHFIIALIFATAVAAEEISITNETLQRTLTLIDGTWTTSKITNVSSGVGLEMVVTPKNREKGVLGVREKGGASLG